ncbi:MAG: hypothetical protein NZ521_09440, partial [Flammeovirgaceae bacterium]|nr:hypothetical protein [Flammeovirgaceae bacterium]MDW8288442.1 hypothetical protein [Flammeovirgaceae bacterium]
MNIKLNHIFHLVWTAALTLVAFSAAAQDKFYYGKNGEKIVLNLATDKVLVKFSDKVDAAKRATWMSKYRALGNVIEKRSNEIMAYIELEKSTARTQKDIDALLETLSKDREVEYASPVFRLEGGEEISMTNKFIVRLPNESDYAALQAFVSQKGLTIERQFSFNKNIFVVKANKASAGTALQMANAAYETGKFKYAQPDFVKFHLLSEANEEFLNSEEGKKEIAKLMERAATNKTSSTTAPTSTIFDPLFYLQYHHQNNGPIPGTSRMNGATPDADLDVVEAWAKTRGQGVKVAVLDEGVDRLHEDINMVKGYDAAFFAGITPNNRNGNPDMI